MYKSLLTAILFLSIPTFAFAEITKCSVGGSSLFKQIRLDMESNRAVMIDLFDKKAEGKITLIRDHGRGKNKINISLEYTLGANKLSVDLILFPILGKLYRVGMAGYIVQDGEKYLDLSGNDEAECV